MYRGFMVSSINGDATYTRGTGTTNETTLGLYQTWVGNKGHFYDVTLRHGKISTDYNVTDLSDNYSTADYSMWATTLYGEYGYKKNLGKGAYIEPSAELILGSVVTDGVTLEGVNARNWAELGIGGNVQLTKSASAYAEVRKMFGNLKSNVNFSIGVRWSF